MAEAISEQPTLSLYKDGALHKADTSHVAFFLISDIGWVGASFLFVWAVSCWDARDGGCVWLAWRILFIHPPVGHRRIEPTTTNRRHPTD